MTATSPGTAAEGKHRRRPGFLTDLIASFDAATKTAAVIGAVLVIYVLGHAAGELIQYLGWVLYLAANGAS